ncbi:unnamed protein product, partial [Ascophyllum nodosum]
ACREGSRRVRRLGRPGKGRRMTANGKGLWSTVMLVFRPRSDKYEVQAYSGG